MSTPSPFIFTKNGLSYRVELDCHYVSDEEMQTLRRYIANLNAENAKLRELVRDMAYCMQYERECDECRMNGADGTITAPVGCDGLRDRMRELGVEP